MWQLSQRDAASVGMWFAGRVMLANEIVVWQLLQGAVVCGWFAGLPVARMPLWHDAQVWPIAITWLKRAPPKVDVEWQASQVCVVCT